MSEAAKLFDEIQNAIIETRHYHPHIGRDCRCGKPARFRCSDMCHKSPMMCAHCTVEKHYDHPLHHIDEWTGTHFTRTSLKRLGLVVQTDLDSGPLPCRHVSETSVVSRDVVVLDHNGFHTIRVHFCACQRNNANVPEWEQLLNIQLFPATWRIPSTAFTFTVLRQFHVCSLTSKITAYDFVRSLAKLTDGAFPQDAANRCREFICAYRVWRFLALARRSGQAHNIDVHWPWRRPGSLTVRCPACPEVGFNVDEDVMLSALETEKHKFTLYLSVDGNFKLQKKNKQSRQDPDDFALNDGHGYFVETKEFEEYLSVVRPEPETVSTCSHFRAARLQNFAKFKNVEVSGVVAVQCARHGFYMPNGMVDLKKGEAFANTDYAVIQAMSEAAKQRFILLTYDIWCQYKINFVSRIEERFHSMVPIGQRVEGAVPKGIAVSKKRGRINGSDNKYIIGKDTSITTAH
ncbi:hypothetical protein R3P38DRAFT_2579553 [Favolaschia claudopus]|uniref:CxC2-like cysteine cluster KDZ transposase-associated domain-containing protein n=1 Tax=Favolaschia claudopus TaxID=2862362 RepID=A0AAV9ZEZ5_9AGAR